MESALQILIAGIPQERYGYADKDIQEEKAICGRARLHNGMTAYSFPRQIQDFHFQHADQLESHQVEGKDIERMVADIR